MKRQIFKPTPLTALRALIIPLLFVLAATAAVSLGLNQAGAASKREGLRTLKESLTRASVKCYAMEGKYPDNLSYIEDHYGIHIDRERYLVRYDVFASNILPDITVIEIS